MPTALKSFTLTGLLCLTVHVAFSQTFGWQAVDGFWDEPANWSLNNNPETTHYPQFLAVVEINHDDFINREITFRRGIGGDNPDIFLNTLMIGNAGSGNTVFKLSELDGILDGVQAVFQNEPHDLKTVRLWVGADGKGEFHLTGGSLTVTNGLTLGLSHEDSFGNSGLAEYRGVFRMDGGDLYLSAPGQGGNKLIDVGRDTYGLFVQEGGHIHGQEFGNEHLRVGVHWLQNREVDRFGRYELNAGHLEIAKITIGSGMRGEFVQTGGINDVWNLQVGGRDPWGEYTAAASYELKGGHLENLGFSTTVNPNGVFTMTDGVYDTRALHVHGRFDLLSGQLNVAEADSVGIRVSGTFTQTGGTVDLTTNDTDALEIAEGGVYTLSGGEISGGGLDIAGTFYQTGGNLDLSGQTLAVAPSGGWTWLGGDISGVAHRVIIDGQAVQSGPSGLLLDMDIGAAVGSVGSYTISGDSDLLSGTIDVGIAGKGILNVQTSGEVSLLNLNVGAVADSEGHVIVRSGTLGTAALSVGEAGSGLVEVRGGLLDASVSIDLDAGGSIAQTGGAITTPVAHLRGDVVVDHGVFHVSQRMHIADGAAFTATENFLLEPTLSLALGSGHVSTPSLELTNASLSAREFIFNGGSLTLTGEANHLNANTNLSGQTITNHSRWHLAGDTVFGDAILEGSGSLINEGRLASGQYGFGQDFTNVGDLFIDTGPNIDSAMLFLDEAFTQTSSGRLVMSVLDPISFTTYDSISFNQEVNLAGTFELVLQEGFSPVEGSTLTLLNFALDFSDGQITPLVNGWFDEVILPELGGGLEWSTIDFATHGSLSIVGSPLSAVPEPSSTAFLLGGIAAMAVATRRRRR